LRASPTSATTTQNPLSLVGRSRRTHSAEFHQQTATLQPMCRARPASKEVPQARQSIDQATVAQPYLLVGHQCCCCLLQNQSQADPRKCESSTTCRPQRGTPTEHQKCKVNQPITTFNLFRAIDCPRRVLSTASKQAWQGATAARAVAVDAQVASPEAHVAANPEAHAARVGNRGAQVMRRLVADVCRYPW
jgi:hypothetical protein